MNTDIIGKYVVITFTGSLFFLFRHEGEVQEFRPTTLAWRNHGVSIKWFQRQIIMYQTSSFSEAVIWITQHTTSDDSDYGLESWLGVL